MQHQRHGAQGPIIDMGRGNLRDSIQSLQVSQAFRERISITGLQGACIVYLVLVAPCVLQVLCSISRMEHMHIQGIPNRGLTQRACGSPHCKAETRSATKRLQKGAHRQDVGSARHSDAQAAVSRRTENAKYSIDCTDRAQWNSRF